MSDPDLEAMAQDELSRAMTLSWRDLNKVIPWGDTFDGISPAGRNVEVERNYLSMYQRSESAPIDGESNIRSCSPSSASRSFIRASSRTRRAQSTSCRSGVNSARNA